MKIAVAAMLAFAIMGTIAVLLQHGHREQQREAARQRVQSAIDTSPGWQAFSFDLDELGRDIANLHVHVDGQIMEAMDVLTPVPTRDWEPL